MRKWICYGVLGGILEFGIIYHVAFSEPDAPEPREARAEEISSPPKSLRSVRAASPGPKESPARPIAAVAATGAPAAPAPSPPLLEVAQEILTPTEAPPVDILEATIQLAQDLLFPIIAPAEDTAISADPAADIPQPPDATPSAAEEPAPPPPVDLSEMPVEDVIKHVFGPEGDKAVAVAFCESTLRTHAKQGQYLGLFQMGENERARYGHGEDVLSQVEAAYALFLHRGWQPWTCA